MSCDPDLLSLARAVLIRNQSSFRDRAWDKPRTEAEILSQATLEPGTEKTVSNQLDNPLVPLSHTLGDGTLGQSANPGAPLGTLVGQYYCDAFSTLIAQCPAYIDATDWRQAIKDGRRFVTQWGEQAEALGWASTDLFGLHTPPEKPAPSYRRLSRYDQTGLVWLLHGRPVIALTATEAVMRCHSGATLTYRRRNEPVAETAAITKPTPETAEIANEVAPITKPTPGAMEIAKGAAA